MFVWQRRRDRVMSWHRFWWLPGQSSSLKMVHNGFYGKQGAAPSHRRACAGVGAFFAIRVACTNQLSWALVHVQVRTVYRCFGHHSICCQTHPPQSVHVRSCMRSLFLRVRGGGWGSSASLYSAFIADVGHYSWHESCVYFFYFVTGVGVAVGVFVCNKYTHTAHTVASRDIETGR